VLIRLPLAEYLRDCGYRVCEASNVAEAKAILDTDTPVDVVIQRREHARKRKRICPRNLDSPASPRY
jgi:hypothetical protein